MIEDAYTKREFRKIIAALMACYHMPEMSNDGLRGWFGKLIEFDLETIGLAFDRWTDGDVKRPPYHSEAVKLCREVLRPPVTMISKKPTAYEIQANRAQSEKVAKFVNEKMSLGDKANKAWAHRIVNSPEMHSDVAVRLAKEALGIKS